MQTCLEGPSAAPVQEHSHAPGGETQVADPAIARVPKGSLQTHSTEEETEARRGYVLGARYQQSPGFSGPLLKGRRVPGPVPDITSVPPGHAARPQRVEQRWDPAHGAQWHEHRGRRGPRAEPGRGRRQQPPAALLALRRQAVGQHVLCGHTEGADSRGRGRAHPLQNLAGAEARSPS